MTGPQRVFFIRIAATMIILMIAVAEPSRGQVGPNSDALAQLKTGTAEDVGKAIRALPAELLDRSEVINQLVLLLDDDRTVTKHLMGRETVQDVARFKLLDAKAASVRSLTEQLSKLKSDRARGRALEVIARIGAPNDTAYSQVLPYCSNKDVYVRLRAIDALGAVGNKSKSTIEQFGEFLKDPDPTVRWTVLDVLDRRRDQIGPLVPSIIELLDDDSDAYIAISAHAATTAPLCGRAARLLASLGSAGPKQALPKLRELTDLSFETNVRVWSATAICSISKTVPPDTLELLGQLLLSKMDNEYADNEAPIAIAQLGPRAAPLMDYLEFAKRHRSPQIRWGLVEAFFAVDPNTALARVIPLIDDKDELVAETAIQAISSRGLSNAAVIDAYIRALGHNAEFLDQPIRSAVDALAKLGPAAHKAIPALKRLLNKSDISNSLKEDVVKAIDAIDKSTTPKSDN